VIRRVYTPSQAGTFSAGQTPAKSPVDLQARVQQNLRSWTTRTSRTFRGQVDDFSSKAAVVFSQVGGKLNAVTGYEEIEKLKKDVVHNVQKLR